LKVIISATGKTLDSQMDLRFGRAATFIIADTDTMDYEALDNAGALAAGGAGISSAQIVIDKGATAVITGNVGPNAMNVLSAGNIEIYRGSPLSVKENIDQLKKRFARKNQHNRISTLWHEKVGIA